MDAGLKKRLLGAVVLIALAVIFVPMLLPSHSDSTTDSASLQIPPQPSGDMQTRILSVGPGGASAGSSTTAAIKDPDHVATLDLNHSATAPNSGAPPIEATNAPVVSAPVPAVSAPVASAPAQVPVQPAATPLVAKATQQPAPTSAKVAPPKPEPVAGGAGAAATALYTVNLGIYSDHASANKLVANAKRSGFTALATPETWQGKSVLRVRVGPFDSRAQAEAARLKLKDVEPVAMTIDGAAVAQTGDAPASAVAASQPGAWAVQMGAFSAESQANALRDRLRAQGFDGYVDNVATAKGKLWRVRAGPFASRDSATRAREQIAQKLKLKGNIVSQH